MLRQYETFERFLRGNICEGSREEGVGADKGRLRTTKQVRHLWGERRKEGLGGKTGQCGSEDILARLAGIP